MTLSGMKKMERRAEDMSVWLKASHPQIFDDQCHLDEGSIERAYWHYGYLMALRDCLAVLRKGQPQLSRKE